MLLSFGWSKEEAEKLDIGETNEIVNQLAEKWGKTVETIQATAEPLKS